MADKSNTIVIDIGKAVEQLQQNPALSAAFAELIGGQLLGGAYDELGRVMKLYQDQVDLNLLLVRTVQETVAEAVAKERREILAACERNLPRLRADNMGPLFSVSDVREILEQRNNGVTL